MFNGKHEEITMNYEYLISVHPVVVFSSVMAINFLFILTSNKT